MVLEGGTPRCKHYRCQCDRGVTRNLAAVACRRHGSEARQWCSDGTFGSVRDFPNSVTGRVGFGSFDDQGEFDALRLFGERVTGG